MARRIQARVAVNGIAVSVIAAIAFLAPVASAQESPAASTLEVEAGHGGLFTRGRSIPVRVTVSADRLLSGELRAEATGSGASVEVPAEVPGGSIKRFLLVLPPGSLGADDRVTVEFRSLGRVIASRAATASWSDAELVGLSPGVLAGRSMPGPARLAVDVGIARFAAVELADLAGGPGTIDSLGTIGLRSEELARLGGASRSGLLAWVSGGGHLLVDNDVGRGDRELTGLPGDWRPGPSGRARAGLGEVRLVGEAMRGGSFDGLVEPTARQSGSASQIGTAQIGTARIGTAHIGPAHLGTAIADTVAGDAGLRLPRITSLLAFLGLYVLVVGPGTALVLRRWGRPELAWVVVPTLAVVFTTAAYVGSRDTRGRTRIAHASVVELDGAGPIASSWVGLTRPGGSARLRFDEGWAVIPTGDLAWPRIRIAGGEPEAELDLDVAQFGLLAATGPISLPGGLSIEASVDGDSVNGVVRNQLPFPVLETVVVLDGRLTPLGRLAPGEERAWSLDAGPPPGAALGFGGDGVLLEDGQQERWFQAAPWQLEGVDEASGRDGVVNLALWQALRSGPGGGIDASGTAVALGWTRNLDLGLALDGRRRSPAGRTALVARADVTAAVGQAPAVAVRRQVVRGRFNNFFGEERFSEGGDSTVLRFTLPPGADRTRPLELRSSLPLDSVEFWVGDMWETALGGTSLGLPPVPGGGLRFPLPFREGAGLGFGQGITVPRAAAASGVVFVRITGVHLGGDQRAWVTVGDAP